MAVIFRIEVVAVLVHVKEYAVQEREIDLIGRQRCYCIANTLRDHQVQEVNGEERKKKKENAILPGAAE